MSPPRVSIVVPVTDRAAQAHDTIASVESQDYPDVEIVVETRERLCDALRAGFARANGDVLAFLHPGELLMPNVLRQVSDALGSKGAVMGRCAVIPPGAQEPLVELPSEFRGLFDHLAIWKCRWDRAARPALFWSRGRHAEVGRFIDAPAYAIDYDVVCRLGRRGIRTIDALWSAQPMPRAEDESEAEQLVRLVIVSRAHWGSWLMPLRWRCELSYWAHAHHRHDHARHHAREAEAAAVRGDRLRARLERLATAWHSPAMARERFGVSYRRLLDRKSR